MIIQIRGTSGSGKTWAMRKVMEQLGEPEVQYVTGRKRPQTYFYPGLVYVLGHYEIACGGCDTLGSVPQIFSLVETLLKPPSNARIILGEGLLLSEDVIWVEKYRDSRIVFLTTSVEECLERVKQRQSEKGRAPADPERVVRKLTRRVETIERARVRLVDAGILCRRVSATQAPGLILDWIRDAKRT